MLTKLSAFKFVNSFNFVSFFSVAQCGEYTRNRVVQCITDHRRAEISCFFLSGFSEISEEVIGKAVHGMFVKDRYQLSVFHMNTLIKMYSGFGNLKYAKQVLDRMPERNGASWNNMISGYIRFGLYLDSLMLFLEMWRGGFELNRYNIPSLLTACSRSGTMLVEGLQFHSLVLKNGLSCDVFVSTSLLRFYGVYRCILDARIIFYEMSERNVVSWTSLMVNYSDAGLFYEVFNLYRMMKFEGVSCNQNTFTTIVSSCKSLDDKFLVQQVLSNVIKSGLETNISVSNSLISAFGSFGEVEIATSIFNMNEHDTISWNSMLAAFADNQLFEDSLNYFHLMRVYHGEIDESTVSTMLSVCDSEEKLKCGRGIHCLVLKMGFDMDICVSNTLISMYFETGSWVDAEKHFGHMPKKDLITWNSILAGYVSAGNWFDTLKIFRELCFDNMLNFVTFTSSLAACADAELLSEGMILHGLVITYGLYDNIVVGNALVTMYGKCGSTKQAAKIFQNMREKEVVTWNSLIGCYAENGEVDEVIRTYNLMRHSFVSPNYITLVNMLGSFCDTNHLRKHGMPFHAHILLCGFECDEYVKNSLISMYANCSDIDSCSLIFCALVDRSSASWNAIVAAMSHNGQWEEALQFLQQMRRDEVKTDQFSLSAALSSSANLAILEAGQQIHSLAIKLGLDKYRFVVNATMDMYGKCGELNDLVQLLPEVKCRSRLSWNIAISAFARHGELQKVQEMFHEMVSAGSKPDHVTFVSLLSAFSHGGLVNEGLQYFSLMTEVFGVPPAIEHCVCIVDLLGRSGRLSEAETFIKEMPVPPNDFIWRSLLASSKIHGDIELSQRAAESLLATNPLDDSAYVLYSGICATSGKWEDVLGLRMKMESDNVKKKPAFSWLNITKE